MANTVTERELATILAALRFWQEHNHDYPNEYHERFMDIVTDDGQFTPLSDDEIDVLADRLNFGGTE